MTVVTTVQIGLRVIVITVVNEVIVVTVYTISNLIKMVQSSKMTEEPSLR